MVVEASRTVRPRYRAPLRTTNDRLRRFIGQWNRVDVWALSRDVVTTRIAIVDHRGARSFRPASVLPDVLRYRVGVLWGRAI